MEFKRIKIDLDVTGEYALYIEKLSHELLVKLPQVITYSGSITDIPDEITDERILKMVGNDTDTIAEVTDTLIRQYHDDFRGLLKVWTKYKAWVDDQDWSDRDPEDTMTGELNAWAYYALRGYIEHLVLDRIK